MQQLAKFLKATGRRLRNLAKVICHLFRKGKLGMKIAIKIPFLVEVEVNFETDWAPADLTATSARFAGPTSKPQHHGTRRPLQVRARPSETRKSPKLRPSRISTRSLRPYRSASRPGQALSSNGPSLISSSILAVARLPRASSDGHFGSFTSGVSISATRIFWPLSQIVSPSTTHALREPVAHIWNGRLTLDPASLA